MVIVVPNEINGLSYLIENLGSFKYDNLVTIRSKKTVDLYLPKFKIESDLDLTRSLSDVNK